MRGVEDEAEVPHGSARHHFVNQRGLVLAMVRHLLESDLPQRDETLDEQIARWLGHELGRTRARYELMVASFHDDELAIELVRGREILIVALAEQGLTSDDAAELGTALDGFVLDNLLRRTSAEDGDVRRVLRRYLGSS